MRTKIWLHKAKPDIFLFNTTNCTQEYVESNYDLIAETEDKPVNWFDNFSIGGQLYDTHAITSYKDTNHNIKNVFASPYRIKTLKEIKQNPQIENLNNAICPACGYVDYHCWENQCPDKNYKCPQCKSTLLLEHRFEYGYDELDNCMYQRTTFKKLHYPSKINICNESSRHERKEIPKMAQL